MDEPFYMQVGLGVQYGAPADSSAMQAMVEKLPEGAVWSGFGTGRSQMPMVAQAALLGGNVRVGLEDNLYLSRSVLATNAQLVDRGRGILERMGATIQTPAEVRERLALKPRTAESATVDG